MTITARALIDRVKEAKPLALTLVEHLDATLDRPESALAVAAAITGWLCHAYGASVDEVVAAIRYVVAHEGADIETTLRVIPEDTNIRRLRP